jgi:hypothetical protein
MLEQDIFNPEGKMQLSTVQQEGFFSFFKNLNYNFKHLNFFISTTILVN